MAKSRDTLNYYLALVRKAETQRRQDAIDEIGSLCVAMMKELNHYLNHEYLTYGNDDGVLTIAALHRRSRYARLLEEVTRITNIFAPDISKVINGTVKDTYSAVYDGMVYAVSQAADTKELSKMIKSLSMHPDVVKRAVQNPVTGLTLPDRLEKNRQNIIYDIKQAVNIGLVNGDRYNTTANRIRDVLIGQDRQGGYYAKSATIARTESHRVQEAGFSDCSKDISKKVDGSGYVYTATWRTMKDERVRPQHRVYTSKGWKTYISRNGANHQRMEGKIIQVGDVFDLGGGIYTESPSNSGDAKNDINCRCYLEYALMTVDEFLSKGGKILKS